MTGAHGCPANSHIIATHPAVGGLTDATLSNWGCSTREGFDSWPTRFDPVVITVDIPSAFVAADGTTGTPYILASFPAEPSPLCLTTDGMEGEVGTTQTVCAHIHDSGTCSGSAVANVQVSFVVVDGPCEGVAATVTTDIDGLACFTWTCGDTGIDVLQASYVNAAGYRHYQKVLQKWIQSSNRPPDCTGAHASRAELWPPNHERVSVNVLGVSDPDGDPVTIRITGITQDEPTEDAGDGSTCPDAAIEGSTALLRAERTGRTLHGENGRVYVVSFVASDGRGGTSPGTISVCVPHDQRPGHSCLDNGQHYNSLACGRATSTPIRPFVDLESATIRSVGVNGIQAVVEYELPNEADVLLEAFDVSGRKLATIEHARRIAGTHWATWDTSALRNGLYYIRLGAGPTMLSKSMLVLR